MKRQLFAGNRDWGTVVRNPLRSQAFWRFVRFYPMDSHKWPCMRVDVFVEIGELKMQSVADFHYIKFSFFET